ncbi:MAG: hypothetical protein C0502_02165 [Opitutus sp.]|nr:hypothetical protein [Opitutus sp.]
MFFSRTKSASCCAAFTLLELLAVLALLGVLATLVSGVGRRASDAGRTARARAELAALAAALEGYRREHGDYPRTGDGAVLLQSLLGRLAPDGATPPRGGRPGLELAKFSVAAPRDPERPADPFGNAAAVLVDPWGQAYRYAFRSIAGWTNPGFVLYSCGPDRLDSPILLPGGFMNQSAEANTDNVRLP